MKYADLENRFGILKEIHHGQWANSYQAHDKKAKRDVFLKILTPAFQQDSVILKRFDREVEIASKIDHPNVVKLIEDGEIENSRYISFEWLEGKTLETFIDKGISKENKAGNDGNGEQTGLAVERAVHFVRQILSGLSAVHEAGIVHRDLKPGNILVDENDVIHLLDFSLAYAPTDARITSHNGIVGTPGYLAPEIVGGGEASEKSDLFAVGIIFYELLIGEPLFASNDIYEILQKVQDAQIPDITEVRDDVPAKLNAFIKKLLAPHPADRFKNADEALENLGSLAVSSTYIRPEPEKIRRNLKVPVTIAAAVIILLNIVIFKYFMPGKTAVSIFEPVDTLALNNAGNSELNDTVSENKPERFSEYKTDTIETASKDNNLTISPVKTEAKSDKPSAIDGAIEKLKSSIGEDNAGEKSDDALTFSLKPADSASDPGAEVVFDSVDISFDIKPWASVYCDGKYLGTTPVLARMKLPAGSYTFRFEHVEFPTLFKRFELTGAESYAIDLDLTQEFGRLEFSVKPWGYVFIDDIERGTTPLPDPIYIEPGEHTIRLNHPDFPEIVRKVSISAGEDLLLEENFVTRSR